MAQLPAAVRDRLADYRAAAMARLRPLIAVLSGALASFLVAGHGLVNYDALYALVWGRQITQGQVPDLDVPIAPTPHPLATLLGVVLAPLSRAQAHGVHGQATTTVVLVLAFLTLGALAWVVYRLGAAWLHPAVGLAAAAIVLTRRPVLDFGARAYVDLPYVVLVLAALLVETRRPRAGVPVLVLLGLAGLLRPEAWLFSAAYVLWTRQWRLIGLAAAAPVLWALGDLALTGDPLHSLTGTRGNAAELQRITGLRHVPATVPRRLGENLREPGLLAAAGGGILTLLWLRERVRLGAAVGVLSLLAFGVLATAGLPILGRYLLLPAAILAIFAGAGLLGWLALEPGDPHRRAWQAFAVVAALAFAAFGPAQVDRLRGLRHALAIQERIQGDLRDLVRTGAIAPDCRPVTVPNRRPIPLLALWLDEDPTRIGSAQDRAPRAGSFVTPASAQVARDYILDPRDLRTTRIAAPRGFAPVARTPSWVALQRGCPTG